MALLNRRRKSSGADHRPVAPPAAAESRPAEGRQDDGIIRASTLASVPEWQKVPPPAPLLPDMPLVVSTHFEDSLVARQPPERFLEPLGHSISPEAPSGLIEGLAVLSPVTEPAPRRDGPAVSPEEPLPLAMPPASEPGRSKAGPTASIRRLEWSDPEAPYEPENAAAEQPAAPAEEPTPAPSPAAAEVAPADASLSVPDGGPDPSSDLVGSSPLEPVVRPLVVQLMPASSAQPLTHAPAPPDMPLAHLPAERLPESLRQDSSPSVRRLPPLPDEDPMARTPEGPSTTSTPIPPAASPDVPAPAQTSELIGDRPILPGPGPAALPEAPAASADTAAPAPELPLAPAAGSARGEDPETVVRHLPELDSEHAEHAESESAVELPEAASLEAPSSSAAPASTEAPEERAAPVAPLVGESRLVTESDQPLVSPPAPSEPAADVADEQPLVPSRPAGRARSGLGEPMSSLPPTARSWDLTSMSHQEQLRASRSMIQSALASTSRLGSAPGQQLATTEPMSLPLVSPPRPAAPESYTVSTAATLPVAPLQRLAEPPTGVVPDDLPAAGAEEAPLLSLARLAAEQPDAAPPAVPSGTTEGARARQEVGRRQGVDLSTVRVDRSHAGSSAATQMRARAFTTASGVVIPPEAGTLETGPGEALLAHELTHVAQRMRLGPNVPEESSAAGRALEHEASATELTFQTGGRAPSALTPPSGSPPSDRQGEMAEALPLAAPTASAPDTDFLAASILEKISALGSIPGSAGSAPETTTTWTSSVPMVASAAAGPVQRAATDVAPGPAAAPATSGSTNGSSGHANAAERPSDQELANLTKWLYPLIKHRLKGDLREDRERAGLLTDHYRKW